MRNYIRFQTPQPGLLSGWPIGIFRASNVLRRALEEEGPSAEWIEELYDWFNRQLPLPPCGAIDPRAVFWFRSEAREHVAEAWKLTAAFRDAGIWVCLHRTDLPGRIVYRDKLQIAAIPYWPYGRGPPVLRPIHLHKQATIPRPRSVPDSHTNLRRSKTMFNSWRGRFCCRQGR